MGDLRRSALPVGCGEVSWRTELAFSQASLRGLGFHRVARGKAFSAESIGPFPIFLLRGGLGIFYLMVLSVSHGVQFTSSFCPTKGNFLCAGQSGGGHIPRYPFALSKETRAFFSPDHFPHSSSSLSSETFIQPQLRPPKSERKSWVWGGFQLVLLTSALQPPNLYDRSLDWTNSHPPHWLLQEMKPGCVGGGGVLALERGDV